MKDFVILLKENLGKQKGVIVLIVSWRNFLKQQKLQLRLLF